MANQNPRYIFARELPVGARIVLGKSKFNSKYQDGQEDIEWIVVAKEHWKQDDGYPENNITIMSKDIIRFMAFDAKEKDNWYAPFRDYGNNRWRVANIRGWLNSFAGAGQWWSPNNLGENTPDSFDASPSDANVSEDLRNYGYASDEGFLSGFSEVERNAISYTNLKTTISSASEQSSSNPTLETTYDRIFLPSYAEITGLNYVYNIVHPREGRRVLDGESARYAPAKATNLALINSPYYSSNSDTEKSYLLRTHANYSDIMVYANGSYSTVKPYSANGIRPMTNIKYDTVLVEERAGVYRIVDNAKPYIIINSMKTQIDHSLDFTVYDYDDSIEQVSIQINNESVQTYNVGKNTFNYVYDIPVSKLVNGVNRLTISANDTRGAFVSKTLDIQMVHVNEIKSGDIVATKEGFYAVESAVINNNGKLELTLDRNLKYAQYKDEDVVEHYTTTYQPSVFINNDYTAIPQYQLMEMESIDYDTENGEAIEEWVLSSIGNTVHTKVDIIRRDTRDNAYVSKVSQIYTYHDD